MCDIARRLNEAQERQTLNVVLIDCLKEIDESPACSRFLFQAILQNTKKLFRLLTSREATSVLTRIFTKGSPVHAIIALSITLNSEQITSDLIAILITFLGDQLEHIFKASVKLPLNDEIAAQTYSDLVHALICLRDRVSNCGVKLQVPLDKFQLWIKDLESHIMSALCSSIKFARDEVGSSRDVNMRIVSALVSRSRNLSYMGNNFLSYFLNWICTNYGSDPIGRRIVERIMTDDTNGIREFESFVSSIILAADTKETLMCCFGYSIKRMKSLQRVCCTRMLLQRVCPDNVPLILASYILQNGGDDMFLQTYMAILTTWSDVSTIRSLPLEQQKYLTRSVLEFSKLLSEEKIESELSNKLFPVIIQGVQERLSSPDMCIRQSGMFVGEYCCSFLKCTDEPLKFDFEEDKWLNEMKRIINGEYLKENIETSIMVPDIISNEKTVSPVLLDSDDEEEDFSGYSIPEAEKDFEKLKCGDEPEKKAIAPRYIRDCIDQLDEKEKYEVFEAAFYSLNDLIRKNAVGFRDVAPTLAGKLIFMIDRFTTKDFEKTRQSCLVSCLVVMPELAPATCDLMYSKSCAFYHRYLILDSILCACKELSNMDSEMKNVDPVLYSQQKVDWKVVVDERIKSKTRYFGKKKQAAPTKSSKFAPVVSSFFYPLVRGTGEEHLQLKGKDAPFLSRVLYTAGEIVQLASSSPSIVKISCSLEQIISPLRYHDESFIRGSVMFCYYSIATAVPLNVFIDIFGERLQSWLEWTVSQAENTDLSGQDRQIAAATTNVLVEKCKEFEEKLKSIS